MTRVAKIGPWIEANSWPILAALMTIGLGGVGVYLAAMNEAQKTINQLETNDVVMSARLDTFEARLTAAGEDHIRKTEASAEHRILAGEVENIKHRLDRIER